MRLAQLIHRREVAIQLGRETHVTYYDRKIEEILATLEPLQAGAIRLIMVDRVSALLAPPRGVDSGYSNELQHIADLLERMGVLCEVGL